MKKIILLLFLSIQILNIYSQNNTYTIKGHVLDSRTESHISYVSISMKGTYMQTETDETGHFSLSDIPEGEHVLYVYLIGYKASEQKIQLKGSNKTRNITLYLDPDDQLLEEVSVTGSLNKINRNVSSLVVTPLTAQTFEATNSTTLSQGLNYVPGVRVETNCQNCGTQEVRINGLEGQYSQMLIDGRPMFSALSKMYGLEQFPANLIEQVELIRGGGSVLYAPTAIGGVINIITREPDENSYQAAYTMSLIDGESVSQNLSLNSSYVNKSKNSGISFLGNMRHRNPWDANNDGFSEIGKNKAGSFGFRSFFKPDMLSKIKAEYHYISEDRRGGDNINKPPHEAEIAEATNYKIHSGSLGFERFNSDRKHKLAVNLSAQKVERDSYYGAGKELNAYGNSSELMLNGDVRYEYNIDKLLFMPAKLTGGFTQEYSNLEDQMGGYSRYIKQIINISSLYVQNEWRDDDLSFILGLRGDKHSEIDNVNIIPRATLRYKIANNLNLRAAYSMGYRAPEITAKDLDVPIIDGKATITELSDALKPERSNSISGGADYMFYNENIYSYLLIEGFYTNLDRVFVDEVIGENASGSTIMQRRNGDGAYVFGFNLEASLQPLPWLDIQAGYTWQRARYTKDEAWSEDADVAPTRRMMRTPNQYGSFSVSANSGRKFSASLSSVYTGSMITPHFAGYIDKDEMKKTKSFFDMTLKLAYNINFNRTNNIELNCGVQNIFNQIQNDFDKGKNRDSNYIYGPSLPRTYFFGVKIKSI